MKTSEQEALGAAGPPWRSSVELRFALHTDLHRGRNYFKKKDSNALSFLHTQYELLFKVIKEEKLVRTRFLGTNYLLPHLFTHP